MDVRERRQLTNSPRPPINGPAPDRRFCQMVQNETLPRKSFYELCCHRKMLSVNQQVIRQIEFFQHRHAAQEIRVEQEVVRLRLHNVANPHQLRTPRKRLQICTHTWRTQVDPANYPQDERVVFRQLQKPSRFLERLT